MARSANDKRQRLVTSAAELFHRQGLAATSLADIAHHADIPPGNVFYYFRAKDDLVAEVASTWLMRVNTFLARLESDGDPWSRLSSFIGAAMNQSAAYAAHGCPVAGLNRELRQLGGTNTGAGHPAYQRQLEWLADQFRAGGLSDSDAVNHARFLLASIQGSFTLGHAANDSDLIREVASTIGHWLGAVRQSA